MTAATKSARRLDWRSRHDPRSRDYPITAVVPEELRTRSWHCPLWLDQGQEGACVGFSWTHELAAAPGEVRGLSGATARALYREAQRHDEWPGESYEGSSVLGGAQALSAAGSIRSYRWAFGIDDVLRALSHAGPVVLGLTWLDSMFEPQTTGLLDCSGKPAGGHAILARGVLLRRFGKPAVRLHNSWGRGWGFDGDAFIYAEDLERLLADSGEACVAVDR